MSADRVVVVGGGVSGLAAAHRLLELLPGLDVVVLEASGRAGGLVRTERVDGFVIERGPDAILTEKPAAVALARRLGLGEALVSTRPEARGAYVVCHGRLERVPDGFSVVAPATLGPLLRSPILSPSGKARAALELLLPRGPDREDESLSSFVTRRFGRELLERLAQPLASGIYGADPERLSLRSTMPRFLELERQHRSVMLGLRRAARPNDGASGARYGLFASFADGMQRLTDALAARLGDRVRTGVVVTALERSGSGLVVLTEHERIEAAAVVVALPGGRAAPLLAGVDDALGAELAAVPYGSAATVTVAVRREDVPHPLDASGFVVPAVERRLALACTWASEKWAGRAPGDHVLLRLFLGGAGKDDVVERADDELVAAARRELRSLMAIEAAPALVRIDRFVRAMPRYHVGHHERATRVRAILARYPDLGLAGTSLHGVGLPDAVRSGEEAAERVARGKGLLPGP